MPTRLRDSSTERRRERRERNERSDRKDRDRDRDRDRKDRDKDGDSRERERRHKSSKPTRTTSAKEKSSSRTSLSSTDSRRRSSMPGVIEEEHPTNHDSKASLPYPSFSRAHSKEAVDPTVPLTDVFTPPSTDINASKEKLATLNRIINGAPPSPPLTDKAAGRSKSSAARPSQVETIVEETRKETPEPKSPVGLSAKLSKSTNGLRSSSDQGVQPSSPVSKKEVTRKPLKDLLSGHTSQRSSSQPTATASIPPRVFSEPDSVIEGSSDGTSIAPEQPSIQRPGSKIPPFAAVEDDTQSQLTSIQGDASRQQTPFDVVVDLNSAYNTPSSQGGPPPPPPPPNVPISIPRVDYLLQHGGLTHDVPKNLLYAGKPMAVQQGPLSPSQNPVVVANLFEPYTQLLADFEAVMQKSGSLAVATGYRSVARRLLDRLEAVFARDISSEYCQCCMCQYPNESDADTAGVSWGEVLELVSGRRELPPWPPFSIAATQQGLGISVSLEQQLQTPFQKLDIDVPEEYREHYIRQSRKTKQSVDKWLARNSDDQIASSSPPEEVDDETLTFAMLTHLPSEQRALFKDMLGVIDKPAEPPRRAPSPEHRDSKGQLPARSVPTPAPQPKIRLPCIVNAGLAIQRLYRLSSAPRDPETAIYLLNNPTLHGALATLAAISSDEWDILISGRFDGFLRSGAEDSLPDFPPRPMNGKHTPLHARLPSRGATPAYGPTNIRSRQNSYNAPYARPASAPGGQNASDQGGRSGAPIALDEETEIATLAEIERDIYSGMEALEDAFEKLHLKAEGVRRALRERSAGLAAAAQRRRSQAVEVRAETPAAGYGRDSTGPVNASGLFRPQWETETDDGLDDDISELAPDDSASNISAVRKRRHKGGKSRRRDERRTPVVGAIDEDDECSEVASSPRKAG